MIKVVDIFDEGRNDFVCEVVECKSVLSYIGGRENEVESGGDWVVKEKNGWVFYGYEGSEYWGLVKIVEEGENWENKSVEELDKIVEEFFEGE